MKEEGLYCDAMGKIDWEEMRNSPGTKGAAVGAATNERNGAVFFGGLTVMNVVDWVGLGLQALGREEKK